MHAPTGRLTHTVLLSLLEPEMVTGADLQLILQ